jgi:hypothetical protein
MSGGEMQTRVRPESETFEAQSARARLEELLGVDLARFLIAALSVETQGRRGSSSP